MKDTWQLSLPVAEPLHGWQESVFFRRDNRWASRAKVVVK